MGSVGSTAQGLDGALIGAVTQLEAHEAVRTLLRWIGEDPEREGLKRTPERVAKALREMTSGYHVDPQGVLATTFNGENYDEVIVVPGIRVTSMCEHHMLPFVGTATVAYLPGADNRIVGLSKLPRLVEVFSRRLQVQERLTRQIADTLNEKLKPRGVAVIIRAQHMCMTCRGVRQHDASMVTSCFMGEARDNPTLKAEILRLV